ncbi:MAG TPA: urea ABC transporter permease subunit UrtC, partial [Methylomirabilota bacterium]|nr:urea ABC transporter permease subunit UrtC [Methylomirabilota bacterium]
CNALPPSSPLHVSNFTLNLFGKLLTYAILALGLDLLWGYAGVLSLGHGVFFGLGAYAMGMHLMLEIGTRSVYQSALPDFMVWNQVTELPLFWRPFHSPLFTLVAVVAVPALAAFVFGFLVFRSRMRGVYLSIVTQAFALCAWLVFNRNEMNLGGTNGLADFKTLFGFPLSGPATQRGLYVATALALVGAYALCRWITSSRAGKVLVAIRDSETRVLFSGYSPAHYKLFVFVVSATLAGVAGALYAPQVGIITPARIGVLPSIEMVVWVAAGGRGTLVGAVVGAIGVNWTQSWLTTSYPDLWPLFLGALFMSVVLFFPDGVVGAAIRLGRRALSLTTLRGTTAVRSASENHVGHAAPAPRPGAPRADLADPGSVTTPAPHVSGGDARRLARP